LLAKNQLMIVEGKSARLQGVCLKKQ